jgi:hypothetical protein
MDHMLDYWYKDIQELLTRQIAGEHINQQAGFSYSSVDFVISADHGQGSFRAGVKVIFRNADNSIKATAIYGLGEIECAKDTGELLALAFIPKLNASLEEIISYDIDENGKLVSDGALAVHKKSIFLPTDGDGPSFYALNVPIRMFITGDLAFYATMVGKEGMDKAHCHWCKLPSSQWQTPGHAPGTKWTLPEF